MFAPNTDELVTELNKGEYHWAIANWGPVYSSHEESSEVLTEELHETRSELNMLRAAYREWKNNGEIERALDMYHFACNAIKELSQVVAVTLKIIESTNPERNPLNGEEHGDNNRGKTDK